MHAIQQPTLNPKTGPAAPGSLSGGGGSRETLRTRFNKYAVEGRPVGPIAEREKHGLFKELQARGFGLYYRWGTTELPETPELQGARWAMRLMKTGRHGLFWQASDSVLPLLDKRSNL